MMSSKSLNTDVDEFIRRFWDWKVDQNGGQWLPNVDVLEKPDAYFVTVEVPGLAKEDVEVDLSGDVLTIRGERIREEASGDDHFRILECSHGRFERNLTFPTAISKDTVHADLFNGILKIRVNKAKAEVPTKIQIKTH